MKVKMTAAALVSMALPLGLAASASAHTIKVSPGHSIQAAIDQAQPGDKVKLRPGTYHESVEIKKNDLTLKGSGEDSTRIEPAGTPAPVCGICIADADDQGNKISTVENVHVKKLTVDGFTAFGVLLSGTSGGRVDHTTASDDGEYGIAAFDSSDTRFEWNNTPRNGEAGLYIGDSPNANATLHGNTSWGNHDGILVRDASFGEVSRNWLFDNCVGLIFVNTPEPVDAGNWTAKDNRTVGNNRDCLPLPEEGIPPFSGLGIFLFGVHDIDIVDNVSLFNRPSGPTVASGGIILRSGAPIGTGPTTNTRVASNVAFHNEPFDITWDGAGTGNVFVANRCETSEPAGLCAKQHGGGKGHGKGHGGDHRGRGHGNGHRKHHKQHGHHKHHKHQGHHKHHKHKH
jgi:hypothetical protein